MDKYQATKTLTEKLAEHFGKLVISDDNSKKNILEKAEYSYPAGNSLDIFVERDFPEIRYVKKIDNGSKIVSQKIEEVIDKIVPPEANYVFLSDKTALGEYKCLVSLTPYAIIGDKEIEAVKRLFYKKYDIDVKEALNTLGIKDFFELYQSYSNNDSEFHKLLFNNFENFKKEFLDFLKDRKYDGDNDTKLDAFDSKFGVPYLNSQFKKLNINFCIPIENKYIKKNRIDELVKLLEEHDPVLSAEGPFSLEFIKFVFTTPYEDQSIEMNKYLLKKFNHILDVKTILLKEFKQGKHFKEYFELLEEGKQKEIVKLINQSGLQNSDYNSFLWLKGFKDVSLDYLKLYKGDSGRFIEYFTNRILEEKKVILKDLLECDFINDEIVEWLNQNETELVREVGFNG